MRVASLSLDLDDRWSYMKTRGDAGWTSFPTYLDVVVPRFLEILERFQLRITVFVVGQDAAQSRHRAVLRSIAEAGHEIGNHSFHHEPWLHLYSLEQVEREIAMAEESIERATGELPRGFRGPGYSFSPAVLETLAKRGYEYDASTFPTFLGPAARAYYFLTAKITADQASERGLLFGSLREGLRPLKPYYWEAGGRRLVEIPVTTMPGLRTPIHASYLLYLAAVSPALAISYFRAALRLCAWTGVQPSLLLHPLDFLGLEDAPELEFFPAMRMPLESKLAMMSRILAAYSARFRVVPLGEHAREFAGGPVVRDPVAAG